MDRLTAIPLRASNIAFYLHTIVLVLSIMALWLCGLPLWCKFLLTGAGMWLLRKQKLLPVSVIDFEQIELVNEQLVLSWLIVLNFRVNESGEKNSGKKYALALWPDMASVDDLRRLRVFLRSGG